MDLVWEPVVGSGTAGFDALQQFVLVKLSHHKDLLSACSLAGQHFETSSHGYGDPQLQAGAVTSNPCNHAWGDRLYLRIPRQNFQPGDQAFDIGAVRDDQATHGFSCLMGLSWSKLVDLATEKRVLCQPCSDPSTGCSVRSRDLFRIAAVLRPEC